VKKIFVICALFLILTVTAAKADYVYWTDWTSATYGNPGSASGVISFVGTNVNVTYSGEVMNSSVYHGNWNYPNTYSKPGTGIGYVDNVPSPYNESIALVGGNSTHNTITFSKSLVNPVMAIQSLGSGDQARYEFTQSFTLLKQGNGAWGGGPNSLTQSGNILYGNEGNGIIQFTGTYSSISWTVPDGENYHMFTIGAPSAVPIPSAMLLFAPGLAGLAVLRRKFTK
jgi:hypothetical protein